MSLATALLPGDPTRLGDFWLAGRLGVGGQGVVYEAYDAEGTRVAVKVLHGDAASDPDLRARFGKEATAARRVASFCTAQVLAAELDAPKPYIVSEYVEGPSLRRAIAEGRRFTGDDLHRLATAVATALTAIHDAGVVHRDLKPDNVLLGPDGPRVIDFGVARTLEMSLTASGLVTGTPTYMAPEVFTGQRAGAPADVFAWGAIVVYAACGDGPFRAETLGAVMHRVLSTDPDLSVMPESLRPLVAAALRKDPLARPTARQLLLGLVSGPVGGDIDLLTIGSAEAGLLGGGTPGDPALGTLAEDAYGFLSPFERNLVPDLFLRMVSVDESGDITVRPVARGELFDGRTSEEGTALHRVLDVFSYLLVVDDHEVSPDTATRAALASSWAQRERASFTDPSSGGETVRLLPQDGRSLVSVSPEGVRIFDLRSGKRTGGWNDPDVGDGGLLGASLSPNGRYLAVAAEHDVRVWDVRTGTPIKERYALTTPLFNGIEFGAGDRYVTIREGDTNTVWDTGTGRTIAPDQSMDVAFSPKGALVALADVAAHFRLLRLPDGTPLAGWHDPGTCTGMAQAVAFSPDGRTLACGNRSTVTLIDLRTRRVRSLLTGAGGRRGGREVQPGRRTARGTRRSADPVGCTATRTQRLTAAPHGEGGRHASGLQRRRTAPGRPRHRLPPRKLVDRPGRREVPPPDRSGHGKAVRPLSGGRRR